MKQQLENPSDIVPFNKIVKAAYYQILKEAKAMLATIEHEELRYSLVREDKTNNAIGTIVHEFINPLLYLRLECHKNGLHGIHYGFEQIGNDPQLSNRTAFFTRSVYRLTSKELTAINIEACVHNDWCITQCSELYEYIEEQQKHHQFQLIKYKPAAMKRKQMKAVA
jgi:hypothetical protein